MSPLTLLGTTIHFSEDCRHGVTSIFEPGPVEDFAQTDFGEPKTSSGPDSRRIDSAQRKSHLDEGIQAPCAMESEMLSNLIPIESCGRYSFDDAVQRARSASSKDQGKGHPDPSHNIYPF